MGLLLHSPFIPLAYVSASGMYDAGTNPAVALGPGPGNGTSVAVVAVHEGLPSGATDTVGCGFPVANEGAIVLDSFPVGARIHA